MIILVAFTPNDLYSFVQDIAAAPAPLITIEIFSNSLLAISTAFISAADEMIAVPC